MNINEIMKLSLDLAGFDEIPADSEIYVHGDNIKKVLFGVDITSAELYMAKTLGYDGVITHHPLASIATAHKVFNDHVKLMVRAGVREEEALKAVSTKLEMLKVDSQSRNYDNIVSVARLLNMPFLNIHQPLDELGRKIMQDKVDEIAKNKDATLGEIVEGLNTIGEFQRAKTNIEILIGEGEKPAGKVVVAHGAYTNGGYDVANAYFEAGVDTVIYIHISYGDYVKLKKEGKGNLIVTGHIASDAVGINPFVEKLREMGITVDTINGII